MKFYVYDMKKQEIVGYFAYMYQIDRKYYNNERYKICDC